MGQTNKKMKITKPKGFVCIAERKSPSNRFKTDLVEPQDGQGIPVINLMGHTILFDSSPIIELIIIQA